MAKSKLLTTKKKHYTKTKADKEREQQALRIALGDEPSDRDLSQLTSPGKYAEALNWYRLTCDTSDARQYIDDLLVEAKSPYVEQFQTVPDVWINMTAGWVARLMLRGANLPPSAKVFFKKSLKTMLEHAGNDEEVDADGNPIIKVQRPSVQDNIRAKAVEVMGELNGMIDDGIPTGWSMYQWLNDNEIKPTIAERLIHKFEPTLSELVAAREKADPQLVEGYRHLTAKQLRQECAFYQAVLDDLARYAQVNKKVRVPRKKKPMSMEKKLKGFHFMSKDDEYKIASIDPQKIMKSTELWTFNTSNRILTVFRTSNNDMLDVKGASIIQYDPSLSVSKRIGRKTEETLSEVLKGGKIALRKLMDNISSSPTKLTDRINDRVILLRVVT